MTFTSRRRVLAADPDPASLRFIQTSLEGEPYAVVAAADGREAFRALKEDPSFAAAVLSYDLPGFNALDLLRRVRADARLSHVHVVVTVGEGVGHAARAECAAAGAVACLPQPFTKHQLLTVVRLAAARPASAGPGPRPGATLRPTDHRYAVIHDGTRSATSHVLADPSTTACGRKVERGRGTEFFGERPPRTMACPFCNG